MTKSSGAGTRTSTASPSPCSVLAGSSSCFSYSRSLGEMSDSCGQWPRGRSLAQLASRHSSTQRYSCSDPSARSALSHISQAWRYSHSRYSLYGRLKRLANCKIHARVGSAISQLITPTHGCLSSEPQPCFPCSDHRRMLFCHDADFPLAPKHEIGEPSNRTKLAKHEHSLPRQEIIPQALKTMRTRTGVRLVVRLKPLSRLLHARRLQKLRQEESGDLNTAAKIVNISLQPGRMEERVHRRGIDS